MRGPGRNVSHVTGRERMPFTALNTGAQVLADAIAGPGVDHLAADEQRALAALHDDDIDNVVMLFGNSVGVPIK